MALCDYFLQLVSSTGGPVEGESTDAQFPKQIRLETWTWGATNAATIGSATGGAGAGKVKFGEFHFTVRVNKASVCADEGVLRGGSLQDRRRDLPQGRRHPSGVLEDHDGHGVCNLIPTNGR